MGRIIPGKYGTKKDVITKKASRLFKEKGFSATSMRDIAEANGIEAPSLYNHISSKGDILQDICYKVANLFTGHLNEVETKNIPLLQKIEQIIRFHIHMMLEEYESVYISDHEWKHLREPYLSNFKNQRKNYRARLGVIILRGIEEKEIKQIDSYVAVLTMLSAIGGIEMWHRSKKNVDATTLEENIVSIFIEGIREQSDNQGNLHLLKVGIDYS